MRRQLHQAARRSRVTRIRRLRVDLQPTRVLDLEVSVPDPAAYLKHRFRPVVVLVNRLTARFDRYHFVYLAVYDSRSGRLVLGAHYGASWRIDPKLADCARDLPLDDIVIARGQTPPPCPSP